MNTEAAAKLSFAIAAISMPLLKFSSYMYRINIE
jgi:hypothetical protein